MSFLNICKCHFRNFLTFDLIGIQLEKNGNKLVEFDILYHGSYISSPKHIHTDYFRTFLQINFH